MITIDRGDSHYDAAGGWAEACHHIGVFLHWAVRRGLASPWHAERVERLAAAPGAYVVQACDAKLLPSDFSAGEPLIRALYGRFLPYYGRHVREAMATEYVLGLDPELLAKIERALDRELRRLAPDRLEPGPLEPVASEPAEAAAPAPQRVRHAKFGVGEVVETSTDGEKVTVDFETVGRKTLLARFVEPIEP